MDAIPVSESQSLKNDHASNPMDYDERTIADALGQKTIEMARHYAKGADLKPKMRGVVKRLDKELLKRRTKNVKPSG